MPIYLCNPGEGENEPWRHGIHVYAAPYDIDNSNAAESSIATSISGARDLISGISKKEEQLSKKRNNDNKDEKQLVTDTDSNTKNTSTTMDQATNPVRIVARREFLEILDNDNDNNARGSAVPVVRASQQHNNTNMPIRRVRHAEVVLIDDVCIAYDRYWLRLRWPGHKGGFAGYIAMGQVSDLDQQAFRIGRTVVDYSKIRTSSGSDDRVMGGEDTDQDDPARDDMVATPPSEPFEYSEISSILTCARTGIPFQTSTAFKLLAMYDDGISPRVTLAPFPTEQIFCRICREGVHEDADTEQPNAANEDADNTNRDISSSEHQQHDNEEFDDDGEPDSSIIPSEPRTIGPILPHPPYCTNVDALQNPMLAPCECSGSMAFVHYLCVEQWRCRSRHPGAHNGLNCETCGKPYGLPPPSERQDIQTLEQEDWLDAMPPHVMQALRQPHIWWQLGAAIVRRRWLRPLAPIFMSPVVAMYCRARRLLKKRGVARRRWACSLCRRRARWKCVRCLRSYYCSRQCQNVSWHIIHKHVCYKPIRFWWSVIVYGAIALLIFPGILRDPFMYDLGVFLVPVSFVVMGLLGGGMATIVKKVSGMDLRGRLLELVVVLSTAWLCFVSWGLVKGFFGNPSACYGSLGSYNISEEIISSKYNILRPFRWAVLRPAEKVYLFWDNLIPKSFWLRVVFCTNHGVNADSSGCFEHIQFANANFMLQENQGEKCASDLMLVICLYLLAGIAFAGSSLLKHHERQRRRLGRRPMRDEAHVHQD